jgi:ketosteroid isomerase-like protein
MRGGIFNLIKKENYMSEQNKTNVRRLVEEVWNKGNMSVADELFAPTYTHHDASTPDVGRGPESEKKRATLYRTAFPDLRLTVEDLITEGETVVARWSCRGAHRGDLNGIAPTGRQFLITGASIVRFAGGKMVEGWINWDALGLMQQLGVVPELGKAKAAVAVR